MSEVNVNVLLEKVWVKFHEVFPFCILGEIAIVPQHKAEHLLHVVSADLKRYIQYYRESNHPEPDICIEIRRLLGLHLWSSFIAVPQALLHWFSILPHVVDHDQKELSNWSNPSILPFLPHVCKVNVPCPHPSTVAVSKIPVRIGPPRKRRDPPFETGKEHEDLSTKRARVAESLDETTVFPVLEKNKQPSCLVYQSYQQKPFTPGIDNAEELEEATYESHRAFAPPSPIASAFIKDVSTSPSSGVDSSSPPMSPNKHPRQMSVETDDLASEHSSVEIVDFKFKAGPSPHESFLGRSERQDTSFRLIRTPDTTSGHEDMAPCETKAEKILTNSDLQHREDPQRLTIDEVFDLTEHPPVPASSCVPCARRGKLCRNSSGGRCDPCAELNLGECDFARPEREQLELRSVYGQAGQNSLFALHEALTAAHRSRLQEHRCASTLSHQAAITITHEIDAYNIISHICQNFTNHGEMIASICTSPQASEAMLETFETANFSLSKGQAAQSNSLYHVVHSLPDEVLVDYPTISRYFAQRGHSLSAIDVKKREGDHLPIPSKIPTSDQGPNVTTPLPDPAVAGPSSDNVFVKKTPSASQVHVSALSLSKNQGSYRSSSSKLAAARKSDPKK